MCIFMKTLHDVKNKGMRASGKNAFALHILRM